MCFIDCVFAGIVIRNDCSPGPAYAVDPKFTRYGKDGTPQYSILCRQKGRCIRKCADFVRYTGIPVGTIFVLT